MTTQDEDGRYFSQYAVDHCVCAYCWGPLVQRFSEEDKRWVAVCGSNENHRGFHHQSFKSHEIDRHAYAYMEVKEFYRQSVFAKEFGLEPRLTGKALQDKFTRLKKQLGRDDSGL